MDLAASSAALSSWMRTSPKSRWNLDSYVLRVFSGSGAPFPREASR